MYDIIVKKDDKNLEVLLVENGNLIERLTSPINQENNEGNIFLGKVVNVLPGMQAAFVDIGENKNSFIHIKDLLPKVDEKEEKNLNLNIPIKDIVKPGMPLLVQVKRNEENKKGAKVSTHISLSGKYIVLMPNANFITISQKIEDDAECKRLKEILTEILPKDMGAIIRTSAYKKSKKDIEEDVVKLESDWDKIKNEAQKSNECPRLIYKGHGIIERIILDLIEKDIRKITINDKDMYKKICETVSKMKDVSVEYNQNAGKDEEIEKQVLSIENRKIWLKSGGFITIDKTEALTAIDVNSGKYIGKKNLEQTVYIVNKEATIEIAKQLKLRNISGIIIIDYIDMHEKENKDKIENLLKEELKKDRSKTQVLRIYKIKFTRDDEKTYKLRK